MHLVAALGERYAGPWAQRGHRLGWPPTRPGPESRDSVDLCGDRVGSLLIVDPPSHEMGPGGLRFTLNREIHLPKPADGVEKFGVREADGGWRGGLGWHLDAHGRGHFGEAHQPTA